MNKKTSKTTSSNTQKASDNEPVKSNKEKAEEIEEVAQSSESYDPPEPEVKESFDSNAEAPKAVAEESKSETQNVSHTVGESTSEVKVAPSTPPEVSVPESPNKEVKSSNESVRSIAMMRRVNPSPTVGGVDFQRHLGISVLEQNKQYTVPESVAAILVDRGAAVFSDKLH